MEEGSAAQAFSAELGKVGKTVMLAFGGGSVKKNGIYDEMKALLEQAGKKVVDFSGIMSNPTYNKVQEGTALAREYHVDYILAVGGSVIDCCKVVSAQAQLSEDIWDMEYGKGQFPTTGIPMGAVVTASGTGAEMNAGAVITYEEKKWKGPIFGTAASFSGKTIIPFCTSASDDIGNSLHIFSELCPDAEIAEGLTANDLDDIGPWLSELGLMQ